MPSMSSIFRVTNSNIVNPTVLAIMEFDACDLDAGMRQLLPVGALVGGVEKASTPLSANLRHQPNRSNREVPHVSASPQATPIKCLQ